MISAAVVLFHTPVNLMDNILKCYKPSVSRKLYVIDNSNTHSKAYEFLKELDNVEYISNGENMGYGKAHNIGIRKAIEAGSEYHIIINPDVSFTLQTIDRLISYADDNKEVVYLLPKVIYPDGEIQYLCKLLPTPFDLIFRRFFPEMGIFRKINDRYILKSSGYNKIINPPCLSGCFMFIRISALEKNNIYFDERFFMYCEDFDLIRRLHRVGKTEYYPYVTIIHDHAKESYKNGKMLKFHIKSAIRYFNKYGWLVDKERKKENRKILKEIS